MRPVRQLLSVTSGLACLLAVAACAPLGACTLLIPFDEVADRDAAALGEAGPRPPGVDATTGDAGGTDGPAVDGAAPGDATTNYDACVGRVDGFYCGGDKVTWPVRDDLVTCEADKVADVRPCTTGQGCIAMLDGYPDECDECASKADGVYCGRDFAGWHKTNFNQRVRCQGGREVGLLLCGGTCKSNGGASSCP
ncbi:MAG: hypothetical protein JWP97_6829 [Labilithrix sp.]|nr:hypothetical protein [Labilithrix sp.]